MAVQITIRGVPEAVRDELAARAALRHQSMQEFLRSELERIVARPCLSTWIDEVQRRNIAADAAVPSSVILRSRD